jgi:hypothetical protein
MGSESRTNSESHIKNTLARYKNQILDLAMHGSAFQAKAKAEAEPCHPDALSQ